jgi:hypothetical protein
MSFSNYKNNGDTVLELFNPLLINILEENFLSISSYSLEPTTSNPVNPIGPEILQLNLKPSFKLDKKNKKVEKDDELEVNKVRNKLKKKFREKIEFDEEFESIPEEDRLAKQESAEIP